MKYIYITIMSICAVWFKSYGSMELPSDNDELLVLCCSPNYYIHSNRQNITGEYVVVKREFGKSFIASAVSNILVRTEVKESTIRIYFAAELFVEDSALQRELQTELFRQYPDEFAKALKTAGNMHNPKLRFLSDAMPIALKQTSTMRQLGKLAKQFGMSSDIVVYGGEKVQIQKIDDQGNPFSDPKDRLFSVYGIGLVPIRETIENEGQK